METAQVEQAPPHTNGISDIEDDERAKMRPVDIDADVREMERRKRVEMIMNSKLFREELERIIESQLKDGSGPSGLLQQISDMVGVNRQGGNVFKSSSCVIPVNDIRGIEAMGYAKGEKILRCKLACLYRLIDLYGWAYGSTTLITARLNQDDEQFLVNPYGMLFHEVTASSLIKVDMQGGVIEQGTTNFSVNITAFSLHAAVHSARPDIKCIVHVHTPAVIAISSLKQGLMPLSQESAVVGDISAHLYSGGHLNAEERDKLARNLGPINKVLLLTNQGALCCGETIEEAFYNARNIVLASEIQLKLMPLGVDNLVLISDEARKTMYDQAHKAPESTPRPDQPSVLEGKVERKWRVGGVEFEALMRMLDNAGFRTGYIYRHPLVKGEPPRPKNDVEVPPAVSSLGYLLEEEELYRQGLWRKLEGGKKGSDRSRWLNSPNTYQKVEILETGTSDPKKITKWVAEGSPNHSSSTPVKIDAALQFVPKGTNPKEFKQKQQQIKDYRRADKISAGPQSHILEGVTWEEAKKMQDATVTQTGDHVVLMGAASKGIIQRGHQHNATVYKSPYAKNPFDSVTDEEINEYKKVVEKKTKGEYDTDYSESEGLSSAAINKMNIRSPTSVTSETEEESHDEPQILRIETKTVPRASQPEVVMSDGDKHRNRQPYRTNSHAGHLKGSYLDPNPVHFHVVRNNEIAIKHPAFDRSARFCPNRSYSTGPFRINIHNAKSISVNIPTSTIKEFILPFATALNFSSATSNKESQTSYRIGHAPLYIQRRGVNLSRSNSFERKILDQLKQNIFDELSSSSESETFEIISSDYDDDIAHFDESFHLKRNEGRFELTPDILAMLPSNGSNSSTEAEDDDDDERADLVKGFVGKLREFTDANFEILHEAKDILGKIPDALSKSLDEGIEDCATLVEDETVGIIDDNAKQLADLILDYLSEQCLEVREIILCPEILHDQNLGKLLAKSKELYEKHFEHSLTAEGKNDLRVSLAKYVLKKLETHDKINTSDDSTSSGTVSDKLFTVSEFLNDILDKLFDTLDDKKRAERNKTFEVTSFHQKTLTECGSELFWISVTNSPNCKKPVSINECESTDCRLSTAAEEASNLSGNADEKTESLSVSCTSEGSEGSSSLFDNDINYLAEDSVEDVQANTLSDATGVFLNKLSGSKEVIMKNQVNFFRTQNSDSYGFKSENVAVLTADRENKENERLDDSGDWMGFEEAKF
ncbi:unnamed protein product [Phyllotreta striolata]|uniref:Class II aldolase/adducin N-terminal domain-containing protein n=1 Tax=Phyllotreta striolata TaxID=444603 RepID=A0A9N9TRW4_PHYSR|nr:unnamed protein product [Phyllotreta striolata]